MKKILLFIFNLAFIANIVAQDSDRKIEFPDTKDYLTLKCDFHIHTTFSDGSVWPNIRVLEAVRDGLDAISLTEHIEYQPHKKDIPHPDRNRSFAIAKNTAKPHDLLVIHGIEITRSMPPGHANAIFVKDANKFFMDDPVEAYREAKKQGAFVFWNHPNWMSQRRDGVAKLTDMHRLLIKENLLHGIEVVNDITYSDEAFEIAQENNLSVIGTSDIHGLVDWQFMINQGGHRPITLVLAEEKSEESIKEALFEGRTIAWFNNLLIGKDQWLSQVINASLNVEEAFYIGPTSIAEVILSNSSDAEFILKNNSDFTFHNLTDVISVAPHSKQAIRVKTETQQSRFNLNFAVLNASNGKNSHPTFALEVVMPEKKEE